MYTRYTPEPAVGSPQDQRGIIAFYFRFYPKQRGVFIWGIGDGNKGYMEQHIATRHIDTCSKQVKSR